MQAMLLVAAMCIGGEQKPAVPIEIFMQRTAHWKRDADDKSADKFFCWIGRDGDKLSFTIENTGQKIYTSSYPGWKLYIAGDCQPAFLVRHGDVSQVIVDITDDRITITVPDSIPIRQTVQ